MRSIGVVFVLVACALGCAKGSPRDSAPARAAPPAPKMRADEWTERCAGHIEAARRALVPSIPAFAQVKLKVDPAPWNPTLRFEVHPASGGYYEGAISHGRHPCIDFDSDDPARQNLPWSDGASTRSVALDRIRRLEGDEAWLQANRVPAETIAPFQSAFEQVLDACLHEGQSVPLGDVPPDFSCMDKVDRCTEDPKANADPGGGCPD
jgi:hypothetical protein